MLSGLLPRLWGLLKGPPVVVAGGGATPVQPGALQGLWAQLGADPRLVSLAFAIANVAAYALLAWWLDRRKIYIRV